MLFDIAVPQSNHAGIEKHLCRSRKITFLISKNIYPPVFFFNVKLQARSYQLGIIKDNFDKTGKCGLQLAGDCFLSLPVTFALQKRSPYTETINRGYIIKKNKIVSFDSSLMLICYSIQLKAFGPSANWTDWPLGIVVPPNATQVYGQREKRR